MNKTSSVFEVVNYIRETEDEKSSNLYSVLELL